MTTQCIAKPNQTNEIQRLKRREWYAKNKEKESERRKIYYWNNRSKERKRNRKYRMKNKTRFHCKLCDTYAPTNWKWLRHLQTKKHQSKNPT